MLHVSEVTMTALHDKEPFFTRDLVKSFDGKRRGRLSSDDLIASDVSTAAPSPEASPILGPEQTSPFCGPEDMLLNDLSSLDGFELPGAEELEDGSEAEFELSGFDDEKEDSSTACDFSGCTSAAVDEVSDSDEDIEGELLDLLSQLASLRSDARQHFEVPDSSLQKIPYPQLELGFLPMSLMPTNSRHMPAGHAETGPVAYIMAPRPNNMGAEPLNICLGPCGATLEIACGWPEEYWAEAASMSASKAKAVFRRGRGRSRSPMMPMMEGDPRVGERGRSPHKSF
jgi:hypothetical protein